jgi:hypothetical protein
LNAPQLIARRDKQSGQEIVFRFPKMDTVAVLPEPGDAPQQVGLGEATLYFFDEPPRDAVSLSRICGQSSVFAEVAFLQPTRQEPLLAGDEGSGVKRSRAETKQCAVDEVANFDRSKWRLRGIDGNPDFRSFVFASSFVDEDPAALGVDPARSVGNAHTH